MQNNTKTIVLISISITITMFIISVTITQQNVFAQFEDFKSIAKSPHCDQTGYPSCYNVGVGAAQSSPGTTICPSGHSKEFCRGWDDYTKSKLGGENPPNTVEIPIVVTITHATSGTAKWCILGSIDNFCQTQILSKQGSPFVSTAYSKSFKVGESFVFCYELLEKPNSKKCLTDNRINQGDRVKAFAISLPPSTPSTPPVTTKPSTPPVTTKPSTPPVTTKPSTPPVTKPVSGCYEFPMGIVDGKVCFQVYPNEKRVHSDFYVGKLPYLSKVGQSDLNSNQLQNNLKVDISKFYPGVEIKFNFYDVIDWIDKSYKVRAKIDTRTEYVKPSCSNPFGGSSPFTWSL